MATVRNYDPVSTNPFVRTLTSTYAWTPGDTVTFFLKPTDLDGNGIDDFAQTGAGAAIRAAYKAWGAVANLRFAEVYSQAAADWTEEMVASGDFGGRHYYPMSTKGEGYGGEYNKLSSSKDSNAVGGLNFSTYLHEIGHGIGLHHTHADSAGEQAFPGVSTSGDLGDNKLNQDIFSVMSYNWGWDAVQDEQWRHEGFGWTGGPMAFDIAAAQELYGANMQTAAGDTVYKLPTANKTGTFFSCIWDAGGKDTISAGDTGLAVTIDLRAATLKNQPGGGGFISRASDILGGFTVANGAVIENAAGGRGNDRLTGNDAANTLSGGCGADVMAGRRGNDTYFVGEGKDKVSEKPGEGIDTVRATIGITLAENVENLRLAGGAARGTGNALDNSISGTTKGNSLYGKDGDDRIGGGGGSDRLSGGKGDDTFVFNNALSRKSNVDAIADFRASDDTIVVENAVFKALKDLGTLADSLFKDLASAKADASDRILYDRRTGDLSYDADGSGKSKDAVRFAHLDNKASLAAEDFLVV